MNAAPVLIVRSPKSSLQVDTLSLLAAQGSGEEKVAPTLRGKEAQTWRLEAEHPPACTHVAPERGELCAVALGELSSGDAIGPCALAHLLTLPIVRFRSTSAQTGRLCAHHAAVWGHGIGASDLKTAHNHDGRRHHPRERGWRGEHLHSEGAREAGAPGRYVGALACMAVIFFFCIESVVRGSSGDAYRL